MQSRGLLGAARGWSMSPCLGRRLST